MIIAIGNDLAEVERIRAAVENPRTGMRFRNRVFTVGEQEYCERQGQKDPQGVEVHDRPDHEGDVIISVLDGMEAGHPARAFEIVDGNVLYFLVVAQKSEGDRGLPGMGIGQKVKILERHRFFEDPQAAVQVRDIYAGHVGGHFADEIFRGPP